MSLTEYNTKQIHQLRAVQRLDVLNEQDNVDYDDLMWTGIQILAHVKRELNPDDVHIKVKVLWRNGEQSWERLDAMHLQDPMLLIEYAKENKLYLHPDWSWTKEYVKDHGQVNELRNALKAMKNKPKYKFGIEVPRSVKHALELDHCNGNTLWQDAIDKELRQINEYQTFKPAINKIVSDEYQQVPYHIVFYIKIGLRRKAHLVAGGNMTSAPPQDDIYSGVVGMESIHLGFLLASLNQLQVCAADIGNAFLYGTTKEKLYIIAGPEFGDFQGTPLLIEKGLYGLRSSCARFREHLAAKLRLMGFKPSYADNDLWMKDCGDYYEYLATYIDDILVFGKDPMATIQEIQKDIHP
jgi:hypothetical protein